MKAVNTIKGRGRANTYFILNDEISLLIIENDVTIVDTKWVNELKKISICRRQKSNGKWDAISRFYCTDGQYHLIQIGKLVCDLKSGKVQELKKGMVYPYDGEQCHHKYNRLDNREESVESLTPEEHKKRHMNKYGGSAKSHHISIKVNLDDLADLDRDVEIIIGRRV